MGDIKLFRLNVGKASELLGDASDLEKPLHAQVTGCVDWLVPDENYCPVSMFRRGK